MEALKIQWNNSRIKSVTRNGVFYYSVTCYTSQRTSTYICDQCVLVKVDRRVPVMILHIQQVVQDADCISGRVRGLLYARPDETPNRRQHYHGEHELLLFHKPISLSCEQLFKMEQPMTDWPLGLPLTPPTPNSTPSPETSASSDSITTVTLLCTETMTPVGMFEAEDPTGASPSGSPVPTRMPSTSSSTNFIIVSFSRYCRYRAVLKRFGTAAYSLMDHPLVQAMGGIRVPDTPTLLVFTRKTFRDITLERKLGFSDGTISYIPKRSRTIPERLQSFCDASGPPPAKRTRGRPPKSLLHKGKNTIKSKPRLLSPTRPVAPLTSSNADLVSSNGDDLCARCTSHRLRNRAEIQRPGFFRDSFFVLEDAIAYSKLQKKHKERKKKIIERKISPLSSESSSPAADISKDQSPPPLPPPPCDANPPHPSPSPAIKSEPVSIPNVDKYMHEEKSFMELLLCFMRMRNTPIRHVPKMGSKKLNLFLMYKAATSLGGYDQVSTDNKWRHIYDALGCVGSCSNPTMTTKEHYEKFLLPFEKALLAMKNSPA